MAEVTSDIAPKADEHGMLDIIVLEERVATIASVPGTPK